MGNFEGMLTNRGKQIARYSPTPASSSWMRQRFTRSQDPNTRNSLWWGYVLSSSSLASGDVWAEDELYFLIQSATPHESGELEWFGLLCNADVTLQRLVDSVNGNGDITSTWTAVGQGKGWVQIVTAQLRVTDPGLVDGAKYTMQVPKTLGAQVLDRLVWSGRNYRVESVDDVAMEGVDRLQLVEDYR